MISDNCTGKDNPAYTQILNEVNNLKIEFEANGEKKKRNATEADKIKFLISKVIIYYQRPWQQAKNKGECRYEKIPDIQKDKNGKVKPHADGKLHYKGRTVIPRSHPLHQEYKIWQQINNVKIWFYPTDKRGKNISD